MEIVLHVGLKKTGSTAIQAWLDREAPALAGHGCFVPKAAAAATETLRTSGNASDLCLLVEAGGAEEVRRFLGSRLEAARDAGCHRLLLSSETLCALAPDRWRLLADALAATGCPTTFVVFEREPYAWYFSVWLQAVKRDGCAAWLDATLSAHTEAFLRPLLTRSLLADLPGDRFSTIAMDYDACRDDAARTFAAALGLPAGSGPPRRYNRSVTAEELFVFYTLNQATGGNMKLCQSLCDKHIVGDEDREPFFFFDARVNETIHGFLNTNGVFRPRAAYPDAPRLTEAAFLDRTGNLAGTLASVMRDAVGFYRNFSESVAGLALHKARHFAQSAAKGLVPPDFDILCYLIANPDVLFADCDPYRHFLERGRAEGRTCGIL